jgi:predicted O-methyltransferase YrrM
MLESILPLQPATAVAVDKYCHTHSTPLPPLFADHQAWTVEKFDKWLMLSGPVQAQLFSFLVSDRGATRVLELGTFTGYSALAWKEGMKYVKGEVWTCEANSKYIEASKEAFRKHDTEGRIHLLEGPAIET